MSKDDEPQSDRNWSSTRPRQALLIRYFSFELWHIGY